LNAIQLENLLDMFIQPLKNLIPPAALFTLLALAGCVGVQSRLAPLTPIRDDYQRDIEEFRREKDAFFRSENSPLDAHSRSSFSGLRYYPSAVVFRAAGVLKKYETAVSRSPAGGEGTPMNAAGLFHFTMAGKNQALEVWQAEDTTELTVLFTDQTNGSETYGAGRYAVLEEAENGMHILDFNYASNPYCHYSQDFVCPLPPPANRLDLRVEAGEKLYYKTEPGN